MSHTRKYGYVFLLVFFSVWLPAATPADRNTITVQGYSKLCPKPDVAYVTVFIEGSGPTVTEADSDATKKADAVKAVIRSVFPKAGEIDVRQLRTGERKGSSTGARKGTEVQGPEVLLRVRITIPPDRSLGLSIIDTAVQAGAVLSSKIDPSNYIQSGGSIVFGVADPEKIQQEAMQKAIDSSKANALKVASSVGRKVGEMVQINLSASPYVGLPSHCSMYADLYPTQYMSSDPNSLEVNAMVSVTYELIPR